KSASKGDAKGVKAPRADRPRKASALRSNQRPNCTNKINVDKFDFHRVVYTLRHADDSIRMPFYNCLTKWSGGISKH
ncbi:hypothetical protein, partial [Peribacillus simplex]|uniref:hypothetical protein n=1 Tax=Peribacillus simplex TaxID=1478 RepID=UPI003D2D3434